MVPFDYIVTQDFSPGVMAYAFVSHYAPPNASVFGAGNPCGRLRIFEPQQIQAQSVPQAGNGIITGQLALQPLTDPTGMPLQ